MKILLAFALALVVTSQVDAAGAGDFTQVALQKHDAGTFYVDGALQGYGDLRMLVDTGSSYLVISQAILADLMKGSGAVYSRQLEGVMADGTLRVIPVYRIAGLRIGADCWVHDVEAAVLPGQTRAILGMNILSRLAPFTFSADPPELGVRKCQMPTGLPVTEIGAIEVGGESKPGAVQKSAGVGH